MCWLLACLTSQQHASVSQGRICSDNPTCCHTETEVADQTFYLTQSRNTDTRPTIPSADLITPEAWRSSNWSANFEATGMTRKHPRRKRDFEPRIFRSRGGRFNHYVNEAVRGCCVVPGVLLSRALAMYAGYITLINIQNTQL